MQHYDSLKEKLQLPFVLLGFIVAAALSLTTLGLLAGIEESAIDRALHAELESFRHRNAINPRAEPANADLLRGYFLPDPAIPGVTPLEPGAELMSIRYLGDTEFSVLVSEVNGKPFALLYDRSYLSSNLARIALLLLIATGVVTAVAYLVGYRLANTVVRPVMRLMEEIMRSSSTTLEAGPPQFEPQSYPRDEIGRLVSELKFYSGRLYAFARRERFFAADVSHELRTPIAIIRGGVEVLAVQPGLSPAVSERLRRIEQQAARMAQILEAMLILGREENPEADPACGMAGVLDDVIADCTPLLDGRPIELRQIQQAHPILPVERALAYVVVSNLVRNACAFTSAGKIELRLDESGLEVEDTGSGLPADRFPELLERHARGADSPGFGLGLSIVARVCERLRWHLHVLRSSEQGTTIRVDFFPRS